MATYRAMVLPHQLRKDGTYNVKIRITHNRGVKYLPTSLYVTKADLVAKSLKLKNYAFIEATDEIIKKYRDVCNKAGDRVSLMSVEQVVQLVTTKPIEANDIDFVAYSRGVADTLIKSGHVGNGKAYISAINSLVRFTGRESVFVNEITSRFIREYMTWIANEPSSSSRAKGGRAVSLYLAGIRALHNRAKAEYNDEDLGVIRVPFSPFDKIKVPKPPLAKKRALTVEQIQRIIDLPYVPRKGCEYNEYCRFNLAKDVFVLSFGLVGMNTVDLYNCTSYKDGRITYERTKTRNRRQDKAEISVRVEPEIQHLVDKYRDKTGQRVFDFHTHYSNFDTLNANVNKLLKKIGELIDVDYLQFYAARHSWATIALNDAKIDKYTVHTALNHVDETMRVTDIYIKKDFAVIDDANRKVLDMFRIEQKEEPKE